MGYNTVLFICNDMLDAIDKDPVGWWAKTKENINRMGDHPKHYGFGSSANGFIVVTSFHSSDNVVVYAGGNTADFEFVPRSFWSVEDRLLNLRHLAEKMGHRLTMQPKRKLHQAWLDAKRMLPQTNSQVAKKIVEYLHEAMR